MSEAQGRMRRGVVVPIGLLILGSLGLNGCVMSEKYEAEKARSLNFQRLLAQEEKRSAELDAEVKRGKRELSDYEARNRELGAQVEAVRQQAAQIQEEAQAMKEASLLEKRAHEDMKRLTTIPKAKKAAPKKDFTAAVDEALKSDVPSDLSLDPATGAAKVDLVGGRLEPRTLDILEVGQIIDVIVLLIMAIGVLFITYCEPATTLLIKLIAHHP